MQFSIYYVKICNEKGKNYQKFLVTGFIYLWKKESSFMKISVNMQNIRPVCRQNFRSANQEWIKIASDCATEEWREYLRDRHLSSLYPRQSKNAINCSKMENVPLSGIQKVDRSFYRGPSLINNLDAVKPMKEAGIERVIDLAGFDEVERACNLNNIEYSRFLIDEKEGMHPELFLKRPIFNTREDSVNELRHSYESLGYKGEKLNEAVQNGMSQSFTKLRNEVDKFTDLIRTIQKGNAYISCEYGMERTGLALMLNYLFNPNMPGTTKGLPFSNEFLERAKNLYKNLTPYDKRKMQWTKSFDECFMLRLQGLVKK